jgi:hypothetical protein
VTGVGKRRWLTIGLLAVASLVATLLVVGHRSQVATLPPASSSRTPADHATAASDLLRRLSVDLRHGRYADLDQLAAPQSTAARNQLEAMARNVRRVGISRLRMRYVDDRDVPVGFGSSETNEERFVAVMELSWRIDGYDPGTSHMDVDLLLTQTHHGAAFVSVQPSATDPAPLWMLEPLRVGRGAEWMVLATNGSSSGQYSKLARQAVVDVHKVLPHWAGKLVVELPRSETELAHVTGAKPRVEDAIAAVTTTADGSSSPASPVHVFVNPAVFGPLGPQGRQIVMSHETTHVATHAVISMMPTWLIEGFADYVALDHVNLPVSETASQILARVRRKGPPAHLPSVSDFDTRSDGLGATYEAAWLACRLIGARYGEARLIRFYRMSDRDGSTTQAFRRVLGTNEKAFTSQWRTYLRGLA